jgi:hypothetical protein
VRIRNPIRYATHIIVMSSVTWVYVLHAECMAPKWGVDRAQMQPLWPQVLTRYCCLPNSDLLSLEVCSSGLAVGRAMSEPSVRHLTVRWDGVA